MSNVYFIMKREINIYDGEKIETTSIVTDRGYFTDEKAAKDEMAREVLKVYFEAKEWYKREADNCREVAGAVVSLLGRVTRYEELLRLVPDPTNSENIIMVENNTTKDSSYRLIRFFSNCNRYMEKKSMRLEDGSFGWSVNKNELLDLCTDIVLSSSETVVGWRMAGPEPVIANFEKMYFIQELKPGFVFNEGGNEK